jgi:hypothetical protein
VNARASKTYRASRSLPRGVVHGANAFALVWKYPDRVLPPLGLVIDQAMSFKIATLETSDSTVSPTPISDID